MCTVHQDAFIKVNQQGESPVQYINTKNIINMERIKNTAMKTIKGTYRDNNYFEYEVNGKKYWVQGELYWNKKRNRLEHTHTGPRGGEYLIYWNF